MGLEIERKFLVQGLDLPPSERSALIIQGYLNLDIDRTVRVRTVCKGDPIDYAYLTVKGRNQGCVRKEFEYKVWYEEGREMLDMCEDTITKRRYEIPHGDLKIEVDVFERGNLDLVVAEIEFKETDNRHTLSEGELVSHLPEWIGKEVTDDPRYYNSSLIKNPYNTWSK